MTGLNDSQMPNGPQPPRDFHRERLSAMMDGALSADEARFLLRRMEHDDELADCWQRWQGYGDALRGNAGRALPADFAQRVGRAIAEDAADAQRQAEAVPARRPFAYWRGVAVAASFALVAVVGARFVLPATHAPTPALADAAAPQPAIPMPQPAMPQPVPAPARALPAPDMPIAAQAAGATLVAAVASGDSRRRHYAAGARPLAELPAALPAAPSAVEEHHAFATQVASAEPPHHPSANGDVAGRPWPKAAVPGLLGSDDVVDLRLEGGPVPPARRVPFEPFGPAVSDGNNAPQR